MNDQEITQKLMEIAATILPEGKEGEAFGFPGWLCQIPKKFAKPTARGTLDPATFHFLPIRRKAGWTLHVWNPADYNFLQNQDFLAEAGFKVMVGCLQWNRVAPLPFDVIEKLLRAAKSSWS